MEGLAAMSEKEAGAYLVQPLLGNMWDVRKLQDAWVLLHQVRVSIDC